MLTRTADPDVASMHAVAADEVTNVAWMERHPEVAILDVVNRFWPVESGWQLEVAEPGRFYLLCLYTHPRLGIGATLLPLHWDRRKWGESWADRPVATLEQWSALPDEHRVRTVDLICLAHGRTRLDLLDALVAANERLDLRDSDESLLDRLFRSSVFMDETTQAMVALNADYQVLVHKWESLRAMFDTDVVV